MELFGKEVPLEQCRNLKVLGGRSWVDQCAPSAISDPCLACLEELLVSRNSEFDPRLVLAVTTQGKTPFVPSADLQL